MWQKIGCHGVEIINFFKGNNLNDQTQGPAWSGNSKIRRALHTEQCRGMERPKDHLSHGTEVVGIKK